MNRTIDNGVLDELVKRVSSSVDLLRLIVFGSVARGETGANSDIDILVVVPDGANCRASARAIYRNLLGFGIATDVVVATPHMIEEYGTSNSYVYKHALAEGKELYRAAA